MKQSGQNINNHTGFNEAKGDEVQLGLKQCISGLKMDAETTASLNKSMTGAMSIKSSAYLKELKVEVVPTAGTYMAASGRVRLFSQGIS